METEEERRARLENNAATKRIRLAMEMDEERKVILEKMLATKWLRLTMETDEERKARLEKIYHTAQVGPGDRGRKKSKKRIGFYLDFIWI